MYERKDLEWLLPNTMRLVNLKSTLEYKKEIKKI